MATSDTNYPLYQDSRKSESMETLVSVYAEHTFFFFLHFLDDILPIANGI